MENLAVFLAIAYLFLAIRQNILCWLCAASSSLIYIALFFNVKLYMESILNIFYFCMAIYGWLSWRSSKKNSSLGVISWDLRVHLRSIFLISMLSIASGYFLYRHTDAAFPYIDSLTTFFSIWATFLVAKKVLENWWYWLIIDIASIAIYWERGLSSTSLLFLLYVVMIPFGIYSWRLSYKESQHDYAR